MVPIPPPGTRFLRSGQTGLRKSKRIRLSKTNSTRRKTRTNKKHSFDQNDKDVNHLEKKKKRVATKNTREIEEERNVGEDLDANNSNWNHRQRHS